MGWEFVVTDLGGNAIAHPEAVGRSYNPGISVTETASFKVLAGSPLWTSIVSGATMLKVYDSFQNLRFYGDIISDEIEGTGQGGSVQFNAADLSFRLGPRFVGKDLSGVGLSYVNQDARAIAFDLLANANAEQATGVIAGGGNVGLSTAPPFTPVAGTFGKTTVGAAQTAMVGDFYHGVAQPSNLNKQVSRYTLGERATISSVSMDLQAYGDSNSEYARAVIYADNGGSPGALLASSTEIQLNFPATGFARQWVTFTGISVTLDPGSYWMGYMAGETNGQINVGYDGGGTRAKTSDTYSDGASPTFGAASTDSATFAVYASYMTAAPVATTGVFVGPTVTYLWKKLLDAISELGAVANSYEWKLRYVDGTPPTVYLDLEAQAGTDRSATVFFEYGTGLLNCGGFRQVRSVQTRATHVYALTSGSTLVAEAYDAAAETPPSPRSEDVLSIGDITDTTLLSSLATQHVAIRKSPRRTVSVTLFKTAPKFGEWEVGDYVTVRANVANTNIVSGTARVWSAQIGIDEQGNENAEPLLEPAS